MATETIRAQDERLVEAQVRERRWQYAQGLTKQVAWLNAMFAVAIVILWPFFRQYTQLPIFAALLALMATSAGLYPLFHRRGRMTLGIHLVLGSFWLTVAIGTLILPAVIVAAGIAYINIMILGMQLLGYKDSRWLIGASVLAFIANVVLVNIGFPPWFIPLGEKAGFGVSVIFALFALPATAITLRIIITGQEDYFRQSQLAHKEIERRATQERDLREYLQTTVQKYVEYMAEVVRGHLAVRIPMDEDPPGEKNPLIILGHSLNETITGLQHMIIQIRDTANDLGSAATKILSTTTQHAAGANEQSTAIAQATTTIAEVRTIAEQTAQRAQAVADLTQETTRISKTGQKAVINAIEGMTKVKDKVERIAGDVVALSEQAQTIDAIITTVTEIAIRSNLLALNAAVEAARAGEAGRGFAVVAQEVRNLAAQSQAATDQVHEILSEIERSVNTSVMTTEEGVKVIFFASSA